VLSALSRAVGTPAFSIAQLLFIFIEGEQGVGERERFRKLAGVPQNVRFMECGSCNEVVRRVEAIKALANEAEAGIRIGGVVDRDFRGTAEVKSLLDSNGVYALPVHEIENFYLHPATLRILRQSGRDPGGVQFQCPDRHLWRQCAEQRLHHVQRYQEWHSHLHGFANAARDCSRLV
jgi:uncharacterized protein DUF4435